MLTIGLTLGWRVAMRPVAARESGARGGEWLARSYHVEQAGAARRLRALRLAVACVALSVVVLAGVWAVDAPPGSVTVRGGPSAGVERVAALLPEDGSGASARTIYSSGHHRRRSPDRWPDQVWFRVVGSAAGENSAGALSAAGPLWTYEARYATTGLGALEPTACWVWEVGRKNETLRKLEGPRVTRARTYSSMRFEGIYTVPSDFYTSPYIHACRADGLAADTEYAFRVAREDNPRVHTVLTPPLPGDTRGSRRGAPFTFAVMGDVGQTEFSRATFSSALALLEHTPFSTLLIPGDLSYSDGDPPAWDTWTALASPLLSRVELIACAGNHEVERGEAFVAYQERFAPGELWHAEQRGPVTFITLNSYSDFAPHTSAQWLWLERTLRAVDRQKTPWLVAQMHVPLFSSNRAHEGEGEEMRLAIEPLLRKYHVDLLLHGHVHAYERTRAMSNFELDPCGSITLVVGDGGNREGPSSEWSETQPAWSAFREATFGFGYLTVLSPSLANWTWVRNPYPQYDFVHAIHEDPAHDTVTLDRSDCPDRLLPIGSQPPHAARRLASVSAAAVEERE
jgi:hypothetical protein